MAKDLWVHPRDESFDPKVHYRDPNDPNGEIYYKAENDIGRAIGDITIGRRGKPLVTMTVGGEILDESRRSKGTLRPVLLWDSDGDGKVDRSVTGRIEGTEAFFDAPELNDVNLQLTRWQLGVRYIAGDGGDRKLDGRYLASVDSSEANIAFIRDEELPAPPAVEPVKAAAVGVPDAPGLVILKHRADEPFDLARFIEDPAEFVEDFDRLSRAEDGDDWNAADRMKGRLATHFGQEDLFIVRTTGGAKLEVEWGDMPMADFFRDYLAVEPDAEGCYSSLSTQLVNEDGSPVNVPHRLFFCPAESVALFDIPDGYQIGLTALFKDERIDQTEASNSIVDNIRLYAKEINPRSPRARATGTVTGNISAGFRDAGSDAVDMLRFAVTGTRPESVHTGQRVYHASPITAVPRALLSLAKLSPLVALDELFTGVDSVIQVGASGVSAVSNAVVNPLVQVTVGNAFSPEAADTTGHWVGALSQGLAKNLPGGERTEESISPFAQWNHNRAFEPHRFTRTDTQLNIDRILTVVDLAIISSLGDDGSDGDGGQQQDQGGDDGGAMAPGNNGGGNTPPPANPGGMNPGGMNPGGMNPGGMNPGGMNPYPPNPGGMNPGHGGMMKPPKKVIKKKIVFKKKKVVAKKKHFNKKKSFGKKKHFAKKKGFKKSYGKHYGKSAHTGHRGYKGWFGDSQTAVLNEDLSYVQNENVSTVNGYMLDISFEDERPLTKAAGSGRALYKSKVLDRDLTKARAH